MKKIISLILVFSFVCLAFLSCAKSYDTYNYDLDDYIDLAEYKNLPANATKKEITDSEVELQLFSTVSYYSRKVDAGDRPIKSGDIVKCYYYGYAEGYSEEILVQDHEIEIGKYKYPKTFEDALVGMKIGDFKTLDTVLPNDLEEYPDLGGRKASVTVVVKDIYEREYPELTDDFVRAYLGQDSIEDLRQSIRESLENTYENAYYTLIIEQIWDEIVENTTVKKYPEAEIKKYYDRVVDSVNDYVTELELNFKDFVEYNFEMTEEEFYDYAMKTAEETVKEEMIIEAIARRENITVSDEEYRELGEKMAVEAYGLSSLEELEEEFPPEEIRAAMRGDDVKMFVADNADISESPKD